jgi:hypothetical protein
MNFKKFINFYVHFSLFQGHLTTVKLVLLIEAALAILIGAIYSFKNTYFVINVTLGALGAK